MGFVASVCQPSTLRMLIWPDASSAQNNIAAVSADGRTVWVLIRRRCARARPEARTARALRAVKSPNGRRRKRAAVAHCGSLADRAPSPPTLCAETSSVLIQQEVCYGGVAESGTVRPADL